MAPEILQNVLDPGSMEYGTPVDCWSLGCVIYQLVSEDHKPLFYKSCIVHSTILSLIFTAAAAGY
ncbi:hypothetical protein P692DRAFT_20120137 [Suillus brevipes Sb2]|nr:hypothetical protein P692DRAFT_20120137 [Suillus brevipes Sb2]